MITYKVKSGDNLTSIAYRYQTTVGIIAGDNPIIKDRNVILIGWMLKIRTAEEYAKDRAAKAKQSTKKAAVVKSATKPPSPNLTKTTESITYKGMVINTGQIGIVTVLRNADIYTFDSKGNLKVLRRVKKGERYRAYNSTTKFGGLYYIGKSYIKKANVSYEALPSNVIPSSKVGTAILTDSSNGVAAKKTSALKAENALMPQFKMPGYRRTRMQVKKPDGKTLSMELRLLAMTSAYSSQYSPSRTNAGWSIHTGGENLTTLNMNGFFLDSLTNREVDDFLSRYKEYLVPKSSDKYYSSQIISILHKNREYKGLIISMSIADQADTPIDRKFSMQFMVLKEKSLTSSEISKNYKLTVDRKNLTEQEFRSSLSGMLANPITGQYNTHL